MTVFSLGKDTPDIHDTAYVAEGATVIGKVVLAKDASVWPQAVLRGDKTLGEERVVGVRTRYQRGPA